MKLSHFIQENKDEITQEWIRYAQNNISRTFGMDLEEVTDHVKEILDRISKDMESSQTADEQEKKSMGNKIMSFQDTEAATAHGEQRLDFGFDFMQLSSEFRALRASVLRLWAQKSRKENWEADFYDMIRFNEAIDEIWMISLERFQTKLDESKNLFLGKLGHDLRNPIAAVKGANAILSLTDDKTKKEKALNLSRSSIKRMTELIDNLLELTELRLGTGMNIKRSNSDLQERLEEIVHEVQLGYSEANIILDAPQPVEGEWDILRIEQMVSNLIINAIGHGEPGGEVYVKLSKEEGQALLTVHNHGSPISEEVQKKIFNTGFSASDERTGNGRNYGLGLLIVKEIVEGHGGTINVRSNRKEGTTFTVKLPLKPDN
ncbi:sensor histidine kinase [Salinimicrobium catena]|uniref:sensor histidine kinase n=1 Tax=Salinimicrobium catena TaxID=390640 RepID=UPI002FE499C7